MSHADSGAVRFYIQGRLVEWGPCVRRKLAQAESAQHQALLTSLLPQPADANDNGVDLTDTRRGGRAVSLTARWLMRTDQGRQHLGAALAEMRCGAQRRRAMQTIAGVYPCRALLHRWGRATSPQCLLCDGAPDTVAHAQCWCPTTKCARIAANHAIAARILHFLQTSNIGRWQFHPELAVGSLRAVYVPLDLHDAWNRMVDELDEIGMDIDQTGDDDVPALARLRPDIWAVSWCKRQVLLLELTRASDWRQDWANTTDSQKIQRYARLQSRMQGLLPHGWTVDTIPLTVGIRGSLPVPAWRATLERFGITSRITQERFFRDLTRQALEELDRMYGVRSEALHQKHASLDARRS